MDNDLEMSDLLEKRILENFSSGEDVMESVTNEKLQEMNKKLPDWNLEPPFTFLK